jgi:hypothetical protein
MRVRPAISRMYTMDNIMYLQFPSKDASGQITRPMIRELDAFDIDSQR